MREKNNLSDFMKTLKYHKQNLTRQQYRTVKGQAFAGDIEGAKKGLYKILERRCDDGQDNNGDAAGSDLSISAVCE